MAKYLAAYWLFGCVVIGISDGRYVAKCGAPSDFVPNAASMAGAVAVWPALAISGFYLPDSAVPQCQKPSARPAP